VGWHDESAEAALASANIEQTTLRANNELVVASRLQSTGQKQQLLLAAAECLPSVDMNDSEQLETQNSKSKLTANFLL
jgi:hypothetical protein